MLLGFILGLGLSLIMCGLLYVYFLNKNLKFFSELEKALQKEIAQNIHKAHLAGSVNYRFKQIKELTEKQLELFGKLDQPSKGASHSRWKRTIIGELDELENKKRDIFQTFLDDNIDPVVKILDADGTTKSIKVSELLAVEKDDSPTTNIKSTESKTHRKNILKLVKEQNDGEDSTNNTSNKTLH